MVGVNGAGKTTTIGKLAAKLKDKHQISLIAADTFRAAAVEQLEIWGQRNNIRVYKGPNGCDAAALCFDGLKEALKQGDDIVFIDTAGRLQNKTGLMDELKKIVKVIKKIIPDAPHATLLTIDATTGQNALNQVKTFKEMVDVSGLIVTKALTIWMNSTPATSPETCWRLNKWKICLPGRFPPNYPLLR